MPLHAPPPPALGTKFGDPQDVLRALAPGGGMQGLRQKKATSVPPQWCSSYGSPSAPAALPLVARTRPKSRCKVGCGAAGKLALRVWKYSSRRAVAVLGVSGAVSRMPLRLSQRATSMLSGALHSLPLFSQTDCLLLAAVQQPPDSAS